MHSFQEIYHAMNETLFKIHNVDIDSVGLGDFGKRGKRKLMLFLIQQGNKTPKHLNPYRRSILKSNGNLHEQ